MCSFESGIVDSIRKHLIDHVNHTTDKKWDRAEKAVQADYKSLLDVFDEVGNTILRDPSLMDSESENMYMNEGKNLKTKPI